MTTDQRKPFAPTRPMTLADQIREAQKIVASWTKEKRDSVQLEGYDYTRRRVIAAAATGEGK